MARILTRKGKKQTTYTITIRKKGFKSVSRTFDTKGEARDWAAEIETEMKGHRFKDPRRANLTFSQAMKRYIENITVQKALTTQELLKEVSIRQQILEEKRKLIFKIFFSSINFFYFFIRKSSGLAQLFIDG